MPTALVFHKLSKHYGSVRALDNVSFSVDAGEILSLVGPNGAGKTTAMQIATGFLLPTSGGGTLAGRDFADAQARHALGYVPDAPVFFSGNAIDAMRFAAQLSDVRPSRAEIEQVLTRVGLHEFERDVRKFSRGMQQRLAIATALIHKPKVLILDEPTSALDPQGVVEIRQLMQQLRAEGAALMLSSHQLSEVALVSDRIAFLDHGHLLRYGTLQELLGAAQEVEIVLEHFNPDAAFTARWGRPKLPGTWTVAPGSAQIFLEAAWPLGAMLVSVTPVRRDLTQLFLQWTSEEAAPLGGSR